MRLTLEQVLHRFLQRWVFEPDASCPLHRVRWFWIMDHADAGHDLPKKAHTQGAKMLRDLGATTGRISGVTVLRGVRACDEREHLGAVHALTVSGMVPLGEAANAWQGTLVDGTLEYWEQVRTDLARLQA